MKAAEREHLNRLASLGCLICRQPAEIHHLKGYPFSCMGKRASHYDAIPLCPRHHKHGGHGVAFHAGQRAFEANFGTQVQLLEQARCELRMRGYEWPRGESA